MHTTATQLSGHALDGQASRDAHASGVEAGFGPITRPLARAVELAQCFFQVVPLSVLCVLGMFLLTNRVAAPVLLV